MTVKVGDYVTVPKGTRVWSNNFMDDGEISSRAVTVEITSVEDLKTERGDFLYLIPFADRQDSRFSSGGAPSHMNAYSTSSVMRDSQLYERLLAKAQTIAGTTQLVRVRWSTKWTLMNWVQPAEEPQRKIATPSVKQLMVKGSRWRLTQDVTFKWKAYGAGYQTVENTSNTIAAGTEFEVTGKMRTSYPDNGLQVPIRRTFSDGSVRDVWWFYNQIAKCVEQIGSMQISVYVLKDTATGLYYGGEHLKDRVWQVKMTNKLSQAKKYDSVAKLKTSLMAIGGYLHGLPGAEDIYYVYGTDNPGIEIPSTWQAAQFDKITKQELAEHDIQTWWTNLWRLRPLTMTFGSAVRKVMSEIEKRGEQDRFKGILMVGNPIKESTDSWDLGTRYYDDEPLAPEVVKEADDAVKSIGLVKGSTIRSKSTQSVAWAFETPGQALMAKLAYSGQARMVVINLDTLQELTA